jgi:ketosteroid isomerase-like protein
LLLHWRDCNDASPENRRWANSKEGCKAMGELTVEERAALRRLEDLEEIRRLLLDYGRFLDGKDFVSLSQLWAEDGVIVNSQGTGPAKGQAAILELMNSMLGPDLAPETGKDFHVFANPIIDLDGDTATVRSFWLYVTPDESGYPHLAQMGHYEDVVTRENGRWRFKSRDWPRDIGIPGGGVPGAAARS